MSGTSGAVLRFKQIDLATSKMDAMVAFYSRVLGLEMRAEVHGGHTHYATDVSGIRLCLAPSGPAGVSATAEGVHQFHLVVADINAFKARAAERGVTIQSFGSELFVSDPDGGAWMVSGE
jgi:catechol 2,3-dioxygenase-like lactoylglutathione lyase family enzyme